MFLIRPEPDKRESLEAYILRLFYLNKIDFKNISKLIKEKLVLVINITVVEKMF